MSPTWRSEKEPAADPVSAAGWLRVALRGSAIAGLFAACFALLAALRLVERPLFGLRRPWTPRITQFVCRSSLRLLGMRYRTKGQVMRGGGAVVANHASWLDILTLNARKRIYFVSKSEVAEWPAIGRMARTVGTVFITRDARDAAAQRAIFEARLAAGHKLLFFPEGTSTDGQRVLPFKSTLFAAFFAPELRDALHVQPVSVVYHAPAGADARFYGWWGEMDFGAHMLKVLAAPRQGSVEVIYHAPLKVADFSDRKALARAAEQAVRRGFETGRPA